VYHLPKNRQARLDLLGPRRGAILELRAYRLANTGLGGGRRGNLGTRVACDGWVRRLCVLLLLVVFAERPSLGTETTRDPFAFFWPSVVTSQSDRKRLAKGETVARVVDAQQNAIALFSATPLDASADRFVSWVQHITALKKGQYVEEIGRFSNPPRLDDLEELTLDPGDIDDLERCRPGQCGLKLSAGEIAELERTLPAAGNDRQGAVQGAFKRLVLARVQIYAASGHRALAPYENRGTPVSLQASFSRLVQQSAFLGKQMPALAAFLDQWPDAPLPRVESFFYWSKERLVAKAIISVTQVSILRGDGLMTPDAIVVGKQIFATHYVDGSLSVAALVSVGPNSRRYLAYLNRSDVDALDGFWGGLVRRILEHRFRSEAPAILQTLRRRLESGDPP
jgi:hypothetical protein